MISPFGRNINVQVCRIVSADVINNLEIFNIIEMNKLRRVFEATGEIPDGAAVIVDGDKEAVAVLFEIAAEPPFAEGIAFCLIDKFLLGA